jgi:hypothetical protein
MKIGIRKWSDEEKINYHFLVPKVLEHGQKSLHFRARREEQGEIVKVFANFLTREFLIE